MLKSNGLVKAIVCSTLLALTITQSARAEELTFALFTKNQTDPIFQELRIGAEKAAEKYGAKIIHYIPVKANSLVEQTRGLEDVAVRKPQAVLYMPVDPKAETPFIAKIVASGIPVINVLERGGPTDYAAFIGQDDEALAYMSAVYLLKALGDRGNIVILEGPPGNATTIARKRGLTKAISERPAVKLLAAQPANHQRLQALQVTENLIQRYSQIDGILAMSDVMAFGAIEALQAAGRSDTKVAGIDGVSEAIELIQQGRFLGTAQFNGFVMGCLAVEAAVHRQDLRRKDVLFDGQMITKNNYAAFQKPAAERTCPTLADYTAAN